MQDEKQLLLLGASGFIGEQLQARLEAAPDGSRWKIIAPERAVLDLKATRSVPALAALITPATTVVMCAGVKPQRQNDLESLRTNLAMALTVAEAVRAAPPRHLIYLSSTAVYGEDLHRLKISEQTPVEPRSYYGMAKNVTEQILSAVTAEKTVKCLTIRPPLVYGENEAASSYGPVGFARAALRGDSITLWGDGSELREFLYIHDLVAIIHAAIEQEAVGVINAVSGTSRTFAEIAAIVSKQLGRAVALTSKPRSKEKADHTFVRSAHPLLQSIAFTPLERGIECILTAAKEP